MSKKIRDYLLMTFVFLFLIMTVGISLYASGYKFNLSWPPKFNRLLQKTGMLAVATEPTRATIYLNDKLQKDLSLNPWKNDYLLTPAKIKNILPGEYELRLEQPGYWPYRQKIRINSGETTFVEDVNLFKENLPLLILASLETNLIQSPDNKYLYLQSAKKILNLKTEIARELVLSGKSDGVWLKNNKLMVAGNFFDPSKDNNDTNYADLIGNGATDWYYEESSGNLYYKNNKSINRLAINNKLNTQIISNDNYPAYLPRENKLYTIINTNNQNKLQAYSINSSQAEGSWALPSNGHYIFIDDITSRIAVYDDQNKTLYLFDAANLNAGPILISNIKSWAVVNNQSLIYANDYEIYIFNLLNSRSDLITRRSEQIEKIIWNASGNYLLFSGPTTLNVLDFKNQNTTLLFRAEKIISPVLDEKNDNLYFWAKVGQQEGVYKMLMK